MKRHTSAFVTLAIGALVLAAPAWAEKQVDQSRPADADVTVSVENLSGSVRVEGWDQPEVKVTGTLGDDTEGLSFEGGRGSISIEVEIPEGRWGRRKDVESHLEIWLPRGAELEVETVSASIRVTGVDGKLDLESVSGGVEARGGSREAELETVSGAIEFHGSGSEVVAESVSGRVTLKGVAGRVEVNTVSGGVDVEAALLGDGQFESVSGEVRLAARLGSGSELEVGAHSGNVTLSLDGEVSAHFEVNTFSGRIDNDFGPDGERTSRFAPGRTLDFTAGSGEARVSVDTFSGNVRLVRR